MEERVARKRKEGRERGRRENGDRNHKIRRLQSRAHVWLADIDDDCSSG